MTISTICSHLPGTLLTAWTLDECSIQHGLCVQRLTDLTRADLNGKR